MNCPRCNGVEVLTMSDEDLECCSCHAKLNFQNCLCNQCGLSWKTLNGHVIAQTDLKVMLTNIAQYMENLQKEALKVVAINEGTTESMSDYIIRCVKCQEVSYEERPGVYKCSVCEFEWEVLKFV